MRYKYYIEMTWVNDSTTKTIDSTNIKHLLIDADYENKYMDTIYGVFNIDKNFVDQIILNAKTASIYMNIYKVDVDAEVETKILTAYSGEMSYFINDDINYNKEIDYLDNPSREDVYRTIHLGLMFKSCIDYNKQTSNTTFVNTTMINAVHSFLQNYPLLLENFKYNDTIAQLIVPPEDSTSKVIEFLNNVKVFYDTKYRLYFEPDCVYLISSSGNPVQKTTEDYAICLFTINSITDTNSQILGMDIDSTNKCYSIQINVKDTQYTMDNDTGKTLNNLSCIINPSKDHSLSALASVSDIMNKISNLKSTLTSSINTALATLTNIPTKLTTYNQAFSASTIHVITYTNNIISAIDSAISILNSAGTYSSTITKINTYKSAIQSNLASYLTLPNQYSWSMSTTLNCISGVANLNSYLSCISAINLSDNIPSLSNSFISNNTSCTNNISYVNQTLIKRVNDLNSIVSNTAAIITLLEGTQIAAMSDPMTTMQTNSNSISTESTSIANYLDSYKSDCTSIFTILNGNIKSTISSLTSISTTSLKSAFTGITTDLSTLGSSAQKALNAITNASTNIINVLKSSNLSLSSLSSIKKDITTITDISNIGMLGISQFTVNLGLTTNGTGDRVIRIANDNANMLKTIAADIKNKTNQFFLNKNDLDFTVFSINKEYLIKNYSTYSGKDGKFLLKRKVVMFIREDDKFMCNTGLEFFKLANDTTSSSTISKMSSAATVSTILANAQNIVNASTGNVGTSDINTIISNASAINTAYTKLTTINSGTATNKDASITSKT